MGGDGFSKNSRIICASLIAQSAEQMLNDMHQAKIEEADAVEINLDSITNFQPWRDNLKLILGNKPSPGCCCMPVCSFVFILVPCYGFWFLP